MRYPYNPVLRAIRHPKSALEVVTLPRRVSSLLNAPRERVDAWQYQLLREARLPIRLKENYERATGEAILRYSGGATIGAQNEVLYYLIRSLRPLVVVETGVAAGFSTAYMLQALQNNSCGHLYSVDLPSRRPGGYLAADGKRDPVHLAREVGTGFVIPERLKHRWTLLEGTSKDLLPPLLDRFDHIDFFWHDSDHSYANMIWEFRTSWRRIPVGGVLGSDDIRWNSAFDEFGRTSGESSFTWLGRGVILRTSPHLPPWNESSPTRESPAAE
jgi:hypothetical protein